MTGYRFLAFSLIFTSYFVSAQLSVEVVGHAPKSVSNNTVCEGFISGVPYVYSFGGIDSTKTNAGIHLNSYRYNTQTGVTIQLPDLPDTLGKIASAANRIGDTIYITGGYHVFDNGNELSSNKLHRFNIATNNFMTDGPDIPQATDDHVQVVWRDSLLILITGWKNTGNITNVQIYNPVLNVWSAGTPIPNSHTYKSFGASGSVIGDTIYYFGGARSSFGFTIQNAVRKGVINPSDPTQITWSHEIIDPETVGYRMAATTVGETLHWLGGSAVTYNYDGIAYNNSGGVPNIDRDLYTNVNLTGWYEHVVTELPMDLRGIANINDSTKYILGGMIDDQMVTNKIYKLTWNLDFLNLNKNILLPDFRLIPQPFSETLELVSGFSLQSNARISIYNLTGQLLISEPITSTNQIISTHQLSTGIYIAIMENEGITVRKKILKSH